MTNATNKTAQQSCAQCAAEAKKDAKMIATLAAELWPLMWRSMRLADTLVDDRFKKFGLVREDGVWRRARLNLHGTDTGRFRNQPETSQGPSSAEPRSDESTDQGPVRYDNLLAMIKEYVAAREARDVYNGPSLVREEKAWRALSAVAQRSPNSAGSDG